MGQKSSHHSAAGHSTQSRHAKLIPDNFKSYEELQKALRQCGLESSQLIIGIDYTVSNGWQGKKTFGGKPLHHMQQGLMNPYQQVIDIMGRTLESFDDDHLIPCFGFGDESSGGTSVFPFFPDRPCRGFQEVLSRYCEITPHVKLAAPTTFAPLIKQAINIVQQTKEYHILLIIADGEVSTSEIPATSQAIVEASNYPISIIMCGVGDGPWDAMEEFDDGLPERKFDNFQFVNFHDVLVKYDGLDVAFAVMALQEIPEQYAEIRRLGLLR